MKVLLKNLVLLVMGTALFCFVLRTVAGETVEKRLYGGEDVRETITRPFFVFVEIYVDKMKNPRNCGGVLVDADIVITAARCFHPYDKVVKVIVQTGNFKLGVKTKKIKAKSVEEYDHKIGYDKLPEKQLPPKIASVRLASKIVSKKDKEKHVLKICGDAFWKDFGTGKQLTTVGMGRIDPADPNSFAEVLQRLDIEVTETEGKCGEVEQRKDTFCAGAVVARKIHSEGRGICEGDEGGPVFYKEKKNHTECLVGVLNGGINAFDNGNTCQEAVLFTSVKHLASWLANKQRKIDFSKKKNILKKFFGLGKAVG